MSLSRTKREIYNHGEVLVMDKLWTILKFSILFVDIPKPTSR